MRLLMQWHNFWQWAWERRRVNRHVEMITAECQRDIHREAYSRLKRALGPWT